MTFIDWLCKVNRAIEARYGLTTDDLPDCPYRDWFEDGMSPTTAARMALNNAAI